MKLLLRLKSLLFGQTLYLTTRDGSCTVIKGVRKQIYRRVRTCLYGPGSTSKAIVEDRTYTGFYGIRRLRGEIETSNIAAISLNGPKPA